jgi:hypothetical protein
VLINNAGVMAIEQLELTESGLEKQFATNHVGHFALAVGLHDALAAAENGARIVSVSSRGHLASPVVFEDREYTPFGAYGQSKTANVLFAVGATDRWSEEGIVANALMPGGIATPLQRHLPSGWIEERLRQAEEAGNPITLKSPEQGAATSVLLATSPQLEGVGGRYFEDCNEAAVLEPGQEQGAEAGVAAYALDRGDADRLWELSLELIGRERDGSEIGSGAGGSVAEHAGISGDVDGVLLQRVEWNDLQSPLVGGRQDDVGGRTVLVGAQPVRCRNAPPGARDQAGEPVLGPRRAEVVTDLTLVLEELRGHHRADRVTSTVLRARGAAPVPIEAGERVGPAELELCAEDVASGHRTSMSGASRRR